MDDNKSQEWVSHYIYRLFDEKLFMILYVLQFELKFNDSLIVIVMKINKTIMIIKAEFYLLCISYQCKQFDLEKEKGAVRHPSRKTAMNHNRFCCV